MNDMSAAIEPKSDQINADDLISGPMTVTIQGVAIKAGTEQPVSIDIGVPGKVYRPCKSMSRCLVAAWGADAKAYTGRSLTLYRDPKVKWGGMEVGGIRISHMSDIDKPMVLALTETRANRKPYTVKPLTSAPKTDKSAQTPSEPLSDALETWATSLADTIRTLTGDDLKAWWPDQVDKEEWSALKAADPGRAQAVYEAVRGKMKTA